MRLHQRRSQPVMNTLHGWLIEQLEQRHVEPNSSLGKAMDYKTQNGAKHGDVSMSLIFSCHQAGVDPHHYLTEVQRHRPAGCPGTIRSNWPNRFCNGALPLLDAPAKARGRRRWRLRSPRSPASARHLSPSCRIARSARRSPSLVGSAYRLMLRPAGTVTEPHRASRSTGTTIGPPP